MIIIDESHRSIYKKYQDIFNYFDAMLLGLTATPKDDIDKNTYSVFDLENGVPTYAYELEQAVEDGYLVDYTTIEIKSRIMEEGINYDDLSEEEREKFEETFEDDENIQDSKYQGEEYVIYKEELVDDLLSRVRELNENSFRVKLHLQYVEKYRNKDAWQNLNSVAMSEIKEHITPLIQNLKDDELAKRFDYLIYTIDLAYLQNNNATKPIKRVIDTAEKLSKKSTIPQVKDKKYIIDRVQTEKFWESADIFELEEVRVALRELIKYIEKMHQKIYYTDFNDEVVHVKEGEPIYNTNDLKNYKKKVEHYLKEHKDELAIYKLRHNKVLTKSDVRQLEKILWEELGTKKDYEKEFGNTPVTRLVRKIVGMDREAANEAFSEFLKEERLNLNQIRFVKLIVDYIVATA